MTSRRCRSMKRRTSQTARITPMVTPATRPSRISVSVISGPPPAETTLVAYARRHAQASQPEVDKAASAESDAEVKAGEHKNDQVERPANRGRRGEEEHGAR